MYTYACILLKWSIIHSFVTRSYFTTCIIRTCYSDRIQIWKMVFPSRLRSISCFTFYTRYNICSPIRRDVKHSNKTIQILTCIRILFLVFRKYLEYQRLKVFWTLFKCTYFICICVCIRRCVRFCWIDQNVFFTIFKFKQYIIIVVFPFHKFSSDKTLDTAIKSFDQPFKLKMLQCFILNWLH